MVFGDTKHIGAGHEMQAICQCMESAGQTGQVDREDREEGNPKSDRTAHGITLKNHGQVSEPASLF